MRKGLIIALVLMIVLLPLTEASAKIRCASCGGTGKIQTGLLKGRICTACGGDGWLNDGPTPGGGGGGGGAAKPTISVKKVTLVAGRTVTLSVKNAKKKVSWSSTKPSVAKVNKKGKVTALKAGKATIVAKVDGKTLKCKITVNKKVFATSVSLTPADHVLMIGEEQNIGYSVSPDPAKITEDYSVQWSSSDPGIVSVDGEGKIRACGEGSADIIATLTTAQGAANSTPVTVSVESGLTRMRNWINAHGGHYQDGDNSVTLKDGVWTFVVQDLNSYVKDSTTMTVDESLTGDATIRSRVWGGYDGGDRFIGETSVAFSQLRRNLSYSWKTEKGKNYGSVHVDVLLSSMECLLKDQMGIGWGDLGTSY